MSDYRNPTEIKTADDLQTLTPEQGARAVRDLLRESGWCQGAYRDANGAFCLNGAIRYVYAFTDDFEGRELLHRRIQNLLEKRAALRDAAYWNDEPGRTKKQVLDLLRSVEKGYGK